MRCRRAADGRSRRARRRGASFANGPVSGTDVRALGDRAGNGNAIAKRPDILLCDEPTGAVDSRTGVQVLEIIERCCRELGALTVIVTHNTAIAAIAERVLLLAGGNIAEAPPSSPRRNAREISW